MSDQGTWWIADAGHWIDLQGHVASQGVGRLVDHRREGVPERITRKNIENMGDLGIEPRSQYMHANTSTN